MIKKWPMRLNTLLVCTLLAACKAAPSPVAPRAVVGRPTLHVQRLNLRVAPLEIAASGVRGQASAEEAVSIKNVSQEPLVVMRVALAGDGADVFTLVGAPAVSRTLMPGQGMDVTVQFRPPPEAAAGVHRCTLQIHLGPDDDLGPLVDVAGLVTEGEATAQEPPLSLVGAALGYAIDVGGEGLTLPGSAAPIGSEVRAPRFVRAKPGAIAVDPIARFSWEGVAFYGLFRGDGETTPALEPLGELAADQHQRLHPEWANEGRLSLDPGDQPFGLYVQMAKSALFTDDRLNLRSAHAARVFPLRSRNGEAIADAFLVAFEHTAPVDYQDFVFVVWNVAPAAP